MNHPPHLPPPSCNVGTHYKLRSLGKVIFVVFLAFLSGITATLVTLAWVVPFIGPIGSYTQIQNAVKRAVPETPDSLVVQQTKQRMMQVYNTQKKVGGAYYSDDARIGDALLLSSDGWAVVFADDGAFPDTALWEGVDHQGIGHPVTRVVKTADAWYVRFDGEGFRIMPFANWENLDTGALVWYLQENEWKLGEVGASAPLKNDAHIFPIEMAAAYAVLPSEEKKSILLNTEGEFVGFTGSGGITMPSWQIDYEIGEILREGKIAYRSFPWKGFFITHAADGHTVRNTRGFYVESAIGKTSTSTVMRGDVVIELDTHEVSPSNLARRTILSPETTLVRILRDGQELIVTSEKIEVTLDRERK